MSEPMRLRLERAEDARLAPWALRSAGATRRYPLENEGRVFDYRTDFQRDRDRIVYSRAFRRLRQKAQAGILPAYEDHRRNRLTHTLEVAQLARTIGRALRLNEDLIEAIALSHDLGQPPFGPAGERALDDALSGRLDGRGGPGLGDLKGFRRTWQGIRVVDRLEKRYGHPGLNLTDAVREGILKADGAGMEPPEAVEGVRSGLAPGFEAQVVALADRIASALHDLDDALQANAVDLAQVERLRAVEALRRKLGDLWRQRASRFMKANAIHRGLTHLLVTSAILASEGALERWAGRHGIADPEGFLEARDHAVTWGPIKLPVAALRLLEDLEGFLEAKVRRGAEADRVDGRGRRVLLGLFAAYFADPTLLEDHVLFRYREAAGVRYLRDVPRDAVEAELAGRYRGDPRFARLLGDYLAGMTDAFALTEHARLLEMGAVPIPSAEQLRREGGR
jgi:dGTPase